MVKKIPDKETIERKQRKKENREKKKERKQESKKARKQERKTEDCAADMGTCALTGTVATSVESSIMNLESIWLKNKRTRNFPKQRQCQTMLKITLYRLN